MKAHDVPRRKTPGPANPIESTRHPKCGQDSLNFSETRHTLSNMLQTSEAPPNLSEFELSLVILSQSFERWQVRCMAAAGAGDMTATDISILHYLNHHGTERTLADIGYVLNIEDIHVVSYSLKKAIGLGLAHKARFGKEVRFATTQKGRDLCLSFREIRESCLAPIFSGAKSESSRIADGAQLLNTLSDRYIQAARTAIASR
jgi:predicted MarR family transcription regulator